MGRKGGGGGVGGQNICHHVVPFVFSIKIDMQNDHVLKKLIFDLLTPPPESGGGGGGKIFATMLLFSC